MGSSLLCQPSLATSDTLSVPVVCQSGDLLRSDIWFPDGNIILLAGGVAFRVHRGQLERHSEVFCGLFSIPQPKEQERLESCPCVELQDSPSDVYYFLVALYDGLYFKKPYANDFPAIAAVLRLSSKYLVEHLRQRCISRLEIDWPSTLVGWDQREKIATDDTGRYTPRECCAHPILVIHLAMDLGLDFLLPAAFYDLCRYGPSKILVGASESLAPISTSSDGPPQQRTVHLPHGLLCQTLIGRETAQRCVISFIDAELKNRPISCNCCNKDTDSGRVCRESFYFIMLNVLRSVGGIACGRDADPLFTLVQAGEMLTRTDFSDGEKQCGLKLCNSCKVDFYVAVKKAREAVWKQMTELFQSVP